MPKWFRRHAGPISPIDHLDAALAEFRHASGGVKGGRLISSPARKPWTLKWRGFRVHFTAFPEGRCASLRRRSSSQLQSFAMMGPQVVVTVLGRRITMTNTATPKRATFRPRGLGRGDGAGGRHRRGWAVGRTGFRSRVALGVLWELGEVGARVCCQNWGAVAGGGVPVYRVWRGTALDGAGIFINTTIFCVLDRGAR